MENKYILAQLIIIKITVYIKTEFTFNSIKLLSIPSDGLLLKVKLNSLLTGADDGTRVVF